MRNKKILKIILSSLLLGSVATSFMINPIVAFAETPLDRIEKTKLLEVDFNNNKAINIVNNKEYQVSNSNFNYVSSVKGNGYEPNNSKITIPFTDLNIANTDSILTVSFLFKYDKSDTGVMPISFVTQNNNIYDLWITDGFFGFNTGNRDLYGITNPFSDSNKFYNVIAEFNFTDITKSKIYIDGVAQSLSYKLQSASYISPIDKATGSVCIGGLNREDTYNIKNKSIIDEVKIFKKSLITDEVSSLSNDYKIPTLMSSITAGTSPYVKLNWATEMLEENIIWSTGFEDGDYKPSGIPANSNNISDISYTGNKSVEVYNSSLAGYGNFRYPPAGAYTSRMVYNNIYGLEPGMKFSASFKVKNTGDNASIQLIPESSTVVKNTKPFHQVYGIANPIIIGADTNGSSFIPIENFDYFYAEMQKKGNFYCFTANKVDSNYGASNFALTPAHLDVTKKGINAPMATYYKKGEQLQWIFLAYPLSLGSKTIIKSDDWITYNYNGEMANLSDYDVATKGLKLIFETSNVGKLYVDDFKLGHATKVRLYRDNNKIYEGYASDFSDTSATDKNAPNKITGISYNMKLDSNYNRNLNIIFNASEDIGTTYNYNITSVDKNNVESPLSKTETKTVTSGLKGYSYVIDKSSSTVPDDVVDTTNNSITKTITDSGVYYLHIKAIDNAGNVGAVTHYKIDIPVLTVQSKPSENMIRLDWSLSDLNNKQFKVYQKKEDSNTFQSIGATDFSSTKQIKVLNVHPNVGDTITYTTWDGEVITDKKSASLKKWMEEPNSENAKGYGKGLIEVTPVTFTEFNENPSKYLSKDSNGNWNYNVVFVGAWDCNGSCALQGKFTTSTENYVNSFVNDGYGLLIGHDFGSFRDRFVGTGGVGQGAIASDLITVNKKGVMTNYPWELGDVGTVLNIPYSHNNATFTDGDIWFKYIEHTDPAHCKTWCNLEVKNDQGSSNHYLVTKNNLGMIQTGHSNGGATSDEQKILANTLFYLNQLSTDNYLNDRSGQDVKAPTIPTLNSYTFTENGEINVTFNPSSDIGSKYKYYIEYEDKSGDKMAISEIKEVEILSGLKGYSYVVDSNPTTIPDNIIEFSSISPVKVKTDTSKEIYVHIKAIDNAGNSSETLHYRLTDMTKPTLQLSLAPNSWTNGSVTINAKATDSESGIKSIVLPNGNVVNTTTTSYTVSANGVYYFKAIDRMGNETISSIIVSNIDKKNPTVTIQNNTNWTNQNVQVTITGTDY